MTSCRPNVWCRWWSLNFFLSFLNMRWRKKGHCRGILAYITLPNITKTCDNKAWWKFCAGMDAFLACLWLSKGFFLCFCFFKLLPPFLLHMNFRWFLCLFARCTFLFLATYLYRFFLNFFKPSLVHPRNYILCMYNFSLPYIHPISSLLLLTISWLSIQ